MFHRDGTHDRLLEGGGILGVFPIQEFSTGTCDLTSGDRVLLFTDGVTEARVPEGEEFGETRLLDLLGRIAMRDAEDCRKWSCKPPATFAAATGMTMPR